MELSDADREYRNSLARDLFKDLMKECRGINDTTYKADLKRLAQSCFKAANVFMDVAQNEGTK